MRDSTDIANAIEQVNGIVAAQNVALQSVKTALEEKTAGGTDISLGVTGASVGDIVKVKAVDGTGKPTEWEAAKLTDEWVKIGEYTWTAEDAASTSTKYLQFTQDADGNPLSLDAIYVYAKPLYSTTAKVLGGLMGAVSNGNWNYFAWSAFLQNNSYCAALSEVVKGSIPGCVLTRCATGVHGNGGGAVSETLYAHPDGGKFKYPITGITFFSNVQPLEGSKFEFYGRKTK